MRTYSTSVVQLDAFANAPTVDHATPTMIRGCLSSVLADKTATTAVTRWGGLLAFFKWATAEGFCDPDPMLGVSRPAKSETVVDILTDDQIWALLNTCRGTSFDALRDNAILRLYLTTGMRLNECATITLDRINIKTQIVRIMGKSRCEREVHLEDKTALALTRCMRARKQHPKHDSNMLWIGKIGPLTDGGIKQNPVRSRSSRSASTRPS